MRGQISTFIVLSNLITILGSVFVGLIASRRLGENWVGVVGAVLTFLIMIFAEIIPKRLGERFNETVCLIMARPIKALSFVFKPITWFIEKVTGPMVLSKSEVSVSREEIEFLAHQGAREGSIGTYEEK